MGKIEFGTKTFDPNVAIYNGKKLVKVEYQGKVLTFSSWYSIDEIGKILKDGVQIYDNKYASNAFVVDKNNDVYWASGFVLKKNDADVINFHQTVTSIAIDKDGNRYVTGNTNLYKNEKSIASNNNGWNGVAVGPDGSWYGIDGNNGVWKNGSRINTGPVKRQIVIDKDNNWYGSGVIDNKIYKNGTVIYSSSSTVWSMAVDSDGNWYAVTSNGVIKNGTSISSLSGNVIILDTNGNWFLGTDTNKVYKNGTEIYSGANKIQHLGLTNEYGSRTGNW